MYDIIMFRNHFCNIDEKHLYIRAPYHSIRLISRWLREIALKSNIIRFISIVSVQQQLLKWELFYNNLLIIIIMIKLLKPVKYF